MSATHRHGIVDEQVLMESLPSDLPAQWGNWGLYGHITGMHGKGPRYIRGWANQDEVFAIARRRGAVRPDEWTLFVRLAAPHGYLSDLGPRYPFVKVAARLRQADLKRVLNLLIAFLAGMPPHVNRGGYAAFRGSDTVDLYQRVKTIVNSSEIESGFHCTPPGWLIRLTNEHGVGYTEPTATIAVTPQPYDEMQVSPLERIHRFAKSIGADDSDAYDRIRLDLTSTNGHSQTGVVEAIIEEGGDRNVMLIGPAGSGKTSIASTIAANQRLQFGSISLSAGVSESQLLGRMLPPTFDFKPSPFLKVFSEGGVFLLDEIDAADPNTLICINSALANGFVTAPDGTVFKRHPDATIIAAANTWGTGGDAEYVGRNQLDEATRDRFALRKLFVDYDQTLEHTIVKSICECPVKSYVTLAVVWRIRKATAEHRIRRTISTRTVIAFAHAIAKGRTVEGLVHRIMLDWSEIDRQKLATTTGRFTSLGNRAGEILGQANAIAGGAA